jgi:hypothetical protein
MKELFGLFAQIAISRKGPQDLPASYLLLALTVAGYWVLRYAVSVPLPPAHHWRMHLAIEIVFTLAWYAVLLRSLGRPERFLQAMSAMFGAWLVMAVPWVAAIHFSQTLPKEHLMYRPSMILALVVAIWIIRAFSYVLKHALELPIAACVLLALVQIFTGEMLMKAFTPAPLVTPN